MKKKGLIISTIVMVVVLIASLTTATYAWFSQAASVSVDEIQFSVDAGADLQIGVAATNAYVSSPTQMDFYSGDDTAYAISGASAGTWTSSMNALGARVNTNLDLSGMTKAVSTGTADTSGSEPVYTMDASFTFGHDFYKANGAGASVTASTVEPAIANGTGDGTSGTTKGDYLDVCFGVAAATDGVESISCIVAVLPTVSTYLGMNAAIHVRYCIDADDTVAGNWHEVDMYNKLTASGALEANSFTANCSYLTKQSDLSTQKPTYTISGITWKQGDAAIKLNIAGTAGSGTALERTIHQIHLIVFVDGYDADCNNSSLGVGSSIQVHFVNTNISSGD
jgi:hypothetical protein